MEDNTQNIVPTDVTPIEDVVPTIEEVTPTFDVEPTDEVPTDVTPEVETPAEDIASPVAEVEEPTETPAEDSTEPTEEAPVIKEPENDRSAFNCVTCNGEGLVNNNTVICPDCQGKGMVA